jgi:hypothetical protein
VAPEREGEIAARDGTGGLGALDAVAAVLGEFEVRGEFVPKREFMPATCGGSGSEVEIWPARALNLCPEAPDLGSGSGC